jgi:chemotaxis methyl-accepting protein methylase
MSPGSKVNFRKVTCYFRKHKKEILYRHHVSEIRNKETRALGQTETLDKELSHADSRVAVV